MLTNDIEILKKALERERKSRELAESFVENRLRELYVNNIQLSNKVVTQEEFQKDLLDNLVDALFVVDFKGEILKINKEATKLLGLPKDSKIDSISQFSNRHRKEIYKLLRLDTLENENEIFNVDHHHDINYDKEPYDNEKFREGNWLYYLIIKGLLKKYIWIHNHNSNLQTNQLHLVRNLEYYNHTTDINILNNLDFIAADKT